LNSPFWRLYPVHVPYELSFTKSFAVADPGVYINDCCWGGDVVRDEVMPVISARYDHIRTGQEDWGWFIWFQRNGTHLAFDICCDNSKAGDFRIRLTAHRKRLFLFRSEMDTPELDEVRQLVHSKLERWATNVKDVRTK
jgi:hypothetical protein